MNQEPSLLSRITFGNLMYVSAVLVLTLLLIRWQASLFASLSERRPRARFFAKMVEPVVRLVLWFAALIVTVQILAPSSNAFFAALGSVALAIGLGAQDLIKNIIGGMVVLANRPYQVGDRVKIGEAYGEVTRIGLQSTRLVTPYDTEVTIPNASVMSAMTFNANSGVPSCQVVTELFLPHNLDPDAVVEVGRDVALSSPYLYLNKPVQVGLTDAYMESPYMILRIRAYVYDHQYEPQMMADITRRAKREFRRLGWLKFGSD